VRGRRGNKEGGLQIEKNQCNKGSGPWGAGWFGIESTQEEGNYTKCPKKKEKKGADRGSLKRKRSKRDLIKTFDNPLLGLRGPEEGVL